LVMVIVLPSLTKPHCKVFLDSELLNSRSKPMADLEYIKSSRF
jgi:hypothetical protein